MQENKTPEERADAIIKNHMIWSMGAGPIPVPIADFFAVSAIQLDMIRQLAKVYEIDFSEQAGKASITSLTSSGLARLGARAVKFIPGVGSILGGITMGVLSGASSYALGQVFKKHFETGGTFLDFEPSRVKKFYDEQFEKGKVLAKDVDEAEVQAKHTKKVKKLDELTNVDSDTTIQSADSIDAEMQEVEQMMKELSSSVSESEPVVEVESDPIPEEEDPISKILKLSEMKDKGIITKKEFEKLKKQIIG